MKSNKNLLLEKNTAPFQADHTDFICGLGPLHYHNYIELELISAGRGYQIFNGKKVTLSVGDLYILRPLDSHQIYGEKLVIQKFIISESQFPKWLLFKIYAVSNPFVVHLAPTEHDFVLSVMQNAEKEYRNPTEYSQPLISKMIEIPFLYYLRESDLTGTAKMTDSFYNILYYIHEEDRYLQPITLKEISKYANYSETYLSKLFHRQYGSTFVSYLISLRIEHAKKLLLSTDLSIQEICIRSGFSSFPNFINMFKRSTGLTPKAFRKTYQV